MIAAPSANAMRPFRIFSMALGVGLSAAVAASSPTGASDTNSAATHEEAIAACEAVITAGLIAPSTYKRINVRHGDTPISVDDFAALIGETDKNGTIYRNIGYAAANGLKLREMIIEGEAQNEFGVPIRRLDRCLFRMSGAEYQMKSQIDLYVDSAISDRRMRDLFASGAVPGAPPGTELAQPVRPCCI